MIALLGWPSSVWLAQPGARPAALSPGRELLMAASFGIALILSVVYVARGRPFRRRRAGSDEGLTDHFLCADGGADKARFGIENHPSPESSRPAPTSLPCREMRP
jgi:hypothetical protein